MQSPYRESSWAITDHEECQCAHACFACRTRVATLAGEARAAPARRRTLTIALLAMGALMFAFTYESFGLTKAIERLTEATRQANALALRPAPTPRVAMAPAPVPPLEPPPVVQVASIRSAIIREGETSFLLNRRLLDLVLEEQAELMRSVRVVPSSVDGGTYPRLLGVRPDSLLGMLGFRDGDCLESINGFDLSSPERALEAYAHLRTADMLEARVRRRGRIVTLLYRLW